MRSKERPLAVVTGATQGIGKAITDMFIERGCRVLGTYGHDDEAAERALLDWKECLDDVVLLKSDSSDFQDLDTIAEWVLKLGGAVRYLVINAGVTDRTPFHWVTPVEWEHVIRVNLTMPFFLVQRLFPHLEDIHGRIVFIGSAMGIRPHAMSFAYGVGKAGLHFLAQSMVKLVSSRGITVNVVAPGFIDTAWHRNKPADWRGRVEKKISLGRFGSPGDIAMAVGSIVEQSYVTGQIFGVDGGYDMA